MFRKRIFLTSVFFLTTVFSVCAQEALKSTEEDYYDFLALEGIVQRPALGYRTLSDSVWIVPDDAEGNIWSGNNLGSTKDITGHISYKLFGPDWYNSFNTAAPYGQNDGALWQGKGYNTSLTAGARLEAYGFEVTIKPQLCFSQNLDFDYMTSYYDSEYGYFWGYSHNVGIDLPQRFGDSAFWTFDWGDTEIRYTWKTFTLGFGTQSPWLGPAWLNPMLGSNNAATYPKLDLGIRKTSLYLPWLGWYIGDIEARMWTGYLSESDYFDNDSSNDHNMLNALSFSFAPSVLPGLTFTFNRLFLTTWAWENLKYIGALFNFGYGVNDKEDGKISFSADWLLPKAGLDIYGEISIDDSEPGGKCGYIAYLFHTMNYTVGLKKDVSILHLKQVHGELVFEWNNLEMSQDFQFQWPYMGLYSHSVVKQGYTNKGQILGAGSGSMGNSQYLGFSVYYPQGKATVFVHRTNPDNNYLYSKAVYKTAGTTDSDGNTLSSLYFTAWKATLDFGISNEYFVTSSLSLSGGFVYEIIINPQYEGHMEYNDIVKEDNFIFTTGISYHF